MNDPLPAVGTDMFELCLAGIFALWLLLHMLSRMPRVGSRVRGWDKAGWLPDAGYFDGIFHNLRVEFRLRGTAGEWDAWRVKNLAEPRRGWHWLVNPWITEDRILTHVVRRLLAAQSGMAAGGPPAGGTFHHRMLCHVLTRSHPGTVAIAVRIFDRDQAGDAVYAAEQELAALPQVHHAA